MKKKFEFNIGERVALASSKEKGRVIGRAKYETGMRQYLVRYVAADGRQEEAWFGADALHQRTELGIFPCSTRDIHLGQALISPINRDQEIVKIKDSINVMSASITTLQAGMSALGQTAIVK